jgi:hypothetical protein
LVSSDSDVLRIPATAYAQTLAAMPGMAKYDKRTVQMWNNDTGFIISNNDENKLLLLAIFLTFDMGENIDGDVNVDLGNLTGGVKEFNNYWQPVS